MSIKYLNAEFESENSGSSPTEVTDLQLIDAVLSEAPLVTHRIFLHTTKELKSAVFLGQLYYWSKKMNHDWFYKTADSWQEELFLSWEEQKRIRKHLISLGILEEKRKGNPAKTYFKLNVQNFISIARQYYSQIQGKPDSTEANESARFRESLKQVSGKPGNKYQGKPETIYITETTTENKKDIPNGISKKEKYFIPFEDIVGYLNEKAGTGFRSGSETTRRLVHTRWEEGYRLEDFRIVVDNQVSKWRSDPEMCQFLRPATLFGPKFESYRHTAKPQEKSRWE